MQYLFGPVRSRRLGRSLGIDLIPGKICTFDCIYCETGAKKVFTCERKNYAPLTRIQEEIEAFLATDGEEAIDIFTITASGEPTLHSGIGDLVRYLKERTSKKVCVLTNGSLFHLADVRQDLQAADIIIPSLDAARPQSFAAINRPAPCIDLAGIIDGLIALRRDYPGQIWLEILLARGINDSDEDLAALRRCIEKIAPDRVQLNTVVRPPLESFALPLSAEEMRTAAGRLGDRVEIIADVSGKTDSRGSQHADEKKILAMLTRRPCSREEICLALGLPPTDADTLLDELIKRQLVASTRHNGLEYYRTTGKENEQ